MKTLAEIIENVSVKRIIGDVQIPVRAVCFDSRKAAPGTVFVAVRGSSVDVHQFIFDVVGLGVSAVVCETMPDTIRTDVTYVITHNTAEALGIICANFYDNPSKSLTLVGVTGTNGKTTTATLLYRLFRAAGYKAGLISTVAYYVNDVKSDASHTTPDSIQLNELMRQMVNAGCTHCFMEVSSHAAVQRRIAGLHFAGGIFSNLTHDHLDFHKTFAEYLKAKKLFFDELPNSAFALVNKDDRNGMVMTQNTRATVKTYALKSMADFRCRMIERHADGMLLQIEGQEAWMQFIGEFNACNLLAVYGAAVLLGLLPQDVLRIMSTLKPVDGRFEFIRSANGVTAVVDYAHTPDALENVLRAIHEITPDAEKQIITVVGCGGDRDKTKRPEMAKIAADNSTRVILTSDNPRSEEPDAIIADMLTGLDEQERRTTLTITSRREAIRTACMMARTGDVILVAGKGHENYQIVKGVKSHFDDREIVREIFYPQQGDSSPC
ncbi:MAG: UDP-N-acetylmuramoyl-L-alanyl-D-glutamate--2,6-diaminopimelate ligase [Bacteroidales bacterium]|jgi:UDP-N-acetylmuramoyl-L-alanyl-D-glutamate--2,6-diaminopimelate ligase|nr:UDP-N-acetylmuramoyl-L-alanyl-D-glutamate--2,6-diaminopimelate ligase [Bacteroidales bacterium]